MYFSSMQWQWQPWRIKMPQTVSYLYIAKCLLSLHSIPEHVLNIWSQKPHPLSLNSAQKRHTRTFSVWTSETETEAFREREAPQESSRCNRGFFCLFVCVCVNAVVMKYWCSLPNCLVKSSRLFQAFHLQHLRKRRGERSWQKRWTQASSARLSETRLPALQTDSIANFLYLSTSHVLCLSPLWLRCSMQGSDRW